MKFLAVVCLCIASASALTPLNPEQVGLVKESWKVVHNQEIEILANFFEKYPAGQARFPAFVAKDLATIKEGAKFATHATRIVSALSEVIELIGIVEARPALNTVLTTLGSDHKRRGIPKEDFAAFESAFLEYISTRVSWGDNVKAAWEQAFDNFFEILFTAY